jgi:hypothetical protein
VCRILLEAGADVRIRNNDGQAPSAKVRNWESKPERKELYEYLKSAEKERAEMEMAFKRAHVENEDEGNGDGDDNENEEEEEEEGIDDDNVGLEK